MHGRQKRSQPLLKSQLQPPRSGRRGRDSLCGAFGGEPAGCLLRIQRVFDGRLWRIKNTSVITGVWLTERAGFEPAIRCDPYTGLANRRIQPLCHLSRWRQGEESCALRRGATVATLGKRVKKDLPFSWPDRRSEWWVLRRLGVVWGAVWAGRIFGKIGKSLNIRS